MSEKKKNFIGMMAPHVREVAARTGLDPRLILAQSAVETGWGGKAPGHNYFGIKSHNREGGQNFMTTEYIRGAPVKKVQNFREYSGPEESSRDYASFILENPRYQEAMKAKGIDDQIKAIGKSGYATDPRYGRKLRAVALGIELPPEPQPEDKPVVQEQRPVEQREQAQPTEQPPPPEQEAEAVNYNQADPRDEPVAFADGGSVDNFIPHDDPRRAKNFAAWHEGSHSATKTDGGSPRVYYHGSNQKLNIIRPGMKDPGAWFTTNLKNAANYARGDDAHVHKVYLKSENPMIVPFDYDENDNLHAFHNGEKIPFSDNVSIVKYAQQNGYDGVHFPHGNFTEEDDTFVVFNPEQIKSATGNNGNFDATEQDINKADGGAVDNQQQRELNPLGFYSHAAEMASQLPQERGSPQQMAGMLTNKYGVKPVEMEGFDEAFAGQPSVTRDQLVQHFTSNMPQIERKVLGQKANTYPYSTADEWQNAISRAERQRNFDESERLTLAWEEAEGLGGQGAPKFQKYTLPSGENYREVLLKLPESSSQLDAIYDRMVPFINTPNGTSSPEFKTLRKQYNALTPTFKSSHYPDLNILAHIRLSDRTGPNNEKILHIEEIQSDWAQKGRKEGFVTKYNPEDIKEIDPANITSERRRNEFWNFQTPTGALDIPRNKRFPTIEAARQHILDNVKPTGVPTAPYVTNTAAWTDLALKDVLREAAEGGYDKVVWTPGAEQAKRYGLGNQVRSIDYMKDGDNSYRLGIVDKRGEGIDLPKETFTAKELEDYLGRDVANKIINDEGQSYRGRNHKSLEGVDLVLGGEGMKAYYDKIVPNQLSKLLKKLDPEARIEAHNLDTRSPADKKMGLPEGQSINTVRAQSIRITPKMRESIKRGLPAYADGGAVDDEDEGLTAYHGSPYDFEQFDTSKIGTGEGAQAYGHGLYFAESEPVAKEYRDRLTDKTTNFRVGDIDMPKWVLRSIETAEDKNAAIEKHRQDFSSRLAEAETERETSNQPWLVSGRISTAKDILAGLDQLQQGTPAPHTKGRMYEVKIKAHPDHFLDWDTPLNEQSEHVQSAIKSIANSVDVDQFDHLALAASIGKHPRSQDYSPRGNDLYADLEEIIGDRTKLSDLLHQHGLKGIRYLDAGSRFSGKGSRNYVVFNHDHVQVKRKYAQGGAIDET
jgi:hypothetical protein